MGRSLLILVDSICFTGVILAAGQGTRMKSPLPKVLQSVLGKPMINYAQEAISDLEKNMLLLVTNLIK